MISLKVARLQERLLILGILIAFVCVPPCTWATPQGDDLLRAAGMGDLARVKALLQAGADVNAKGEGGITALMLASLNGRADIVRVLLDARAEVNASDKEGFTALLAAAQYSHLEVVRALLAAKADVNA
jgi:ankyrin repeat protein